MLRTRLSMTCAHMKRLLFTLVALALLAGSSRAQDNIRPAPVTTLTTTTYYASIALTWTATGDDSLTGNATSYEVYWSTSPITQSNWQSANLLCSGSSAPNGSQNGCCKDVVPCATTTFYFVVFLIDDAGNRSAISNLASGHARCTAPFQFCTD